MPPQRHIDAEAAQSSADGACEAGARVEQLRETDEHHAAVLSTEDARLCTVQRRPARQVRQLVVAERGERAAERFGRAHGCLLDTRCRSSETWCRNSATSCHSAIADLQFTLRIRSPNTPPTRWRDLNGAVVARRGVALCLSTTREHAAIPLHTPYRVPRRCHSARRYSP